MKKRGFIVGIALTFMVQIVTLIAFAIAMPDSSQDILEINEIVHLVQNDWDNVGKHESKSTLNYAVLDMDGKVLFRSKSDISDSINAAIAHKDTILDIIINDSVVGKIIIYNNFESSFLQQKQIGTVIFLMFICVQIGLCAIYALYINNVVIRPFTKLKVFAAKIASGNFDVPLQMDKHNVFGAFTESFDIMRVELMRAKKAEAEANKSKKELVAKLSHDIKTPIASIQAVAEVASLTAESLKSKNSYTQIIQKADQINSLVSNLFSATLEELEQLSISPVDFGSNEILDLLKNSDYLNAACIPEIPECLIWGDKQRLQQVFDNIFANSYKYAGTKIDISVTREDKYLFIRIEDYGGGVKNEELPFLADKFKRGSNTENKDGVGLGLYISDYFMKAMGGKLELKNGKNGLIVAVSIKIS